MGLMEQAYETYCALESKYVGRYLSELQEPLVPISHQIVNSDIEITLDGEGNLLNAALTDKSNAAIIIPVTEQSAGRVGETSCAHPLCDQIRFLTPSYPEKYAAYLTQLHAWENSPFTHPKLHAVARYVEKGSILSDMERFGLITLTDAGLPVKEKLIVCWRILSQIDREPAECWKDRSLFQSFIQYYASQQNPETVFCMVSGKYTVAASQHPKKIIKTSANAKLISSNDTSGFTYRGRFFDAQQAATVGYDVSQKVHSVLHWLAANQGVSLGGRTFLCWNPQGVKLPPVNSPILQKDSTPRIKYSDYRQALENAIKGWKEELSPDSKAVIAAFDASTSGRLSLTYYSELLASDFLERLHYWDASCCWQNGSFGICAPSLFRIVNCAFGTVRTVKNQEKLETDDRIMRQQIQRLISCRVDKAKLPQDIERAVVTRASNLQILGPGLRENVLFTACAVIRKYHYDVKKEEWEMSLVRDKKDISYQYGRLLAVLEKIERDTYDRDEGRETNAIRMQSVFAQRPQYASRVIWEQLKKAYYPRIAPSSRAFYDRLIGEIIKAISEYPETEQNRPLKDTYLIGYYLQRNELYQSRTEEKTQEEEK